MKNDQHTITDLQEAYFADKVIILDEYKNIKSKGNLIDLKRAWMEAYRKKHDCGYTHAYQAFMKHLNELVNNNQLKFKSYEHNTNRKTENEGGKQSDGCLHGQLSLHFKW